MFTGKKRSKWFLLKFSMVFVFIALFSLFIMLLWNWLLPEIFGIKSISYLQAIGLLILSKLLFSGVGGRGHGHQHGHRGYYWNKRTEYEADTSGTESTNA